MTREAVLSGLQNSIEAHGLLVDVAVQRTPQQLLLSTNPLVETVIEVRSRPSAMRAAGVCDEVTITSVLREVLPKISLHSTSNLNA